MLAQNETQWTQDYLDKRAGNTGLPNAVLTKYRHPDIKTAVIRDSREKCIYCESKPTAVSPGAVEHILPKADGKFPEKVVQWENLGFVCTDCNTCKGDHWDSEAPILDPYRDEPSEYLVFLGPLVLAKTGKIRAVVTVQRLKLDSRVPLIKRKAQAIRMLKDYLQSWAASEEGPFKKVLEEKVRQFAQASEEYTATMRAILDDEGFSY